MLREYRLPLLVLPVLAGVAAWCLGQAYSLSSTDPAVPDLIFSHRSHLAREAADCRDCHAAAFSSTDALENNLPEEEVCLRCHDGRRARNDCTLCHRNPGNVQTLPAAARSYRFDHSLHLSFGNAAPALASAIDAGRYLSDPGDARRHLDTGNACEACHRGVREADSSVEGLLPRMADCLVCHSRIDPPFSCGYCHNKDAVLKPESHTATFADLHSSRSEVPDKGTCKVCHGVKFTCMGCH